MFANISHSANSSAVRIHAEKLSNLRSKTPLSIDQHHTTDVFHAFQSIGDPDEIWRGGGGSGGGGGGGVNGGGGGVVAEKDGKSKKSSFFAELTGAKSTKRMQVSGILDTILVV